MRIQVDKPFLRLGIAMANDTSKLELVHFYEQVGTHERHCGFVVMTLKGGELLQAKLRLAELYEEKLR